jgi:hypothetical protein
LSAEKKEGARVERVDNNDYDKDMAHQTWGVQNEYWALSIYLCYAVPHNLLKTLVLCEISGSHGGEYDDSFLGYSAV